MTKFINLVENEFHLHIRNYQDLYAWSIEHPENFWRAMWKFGGILAEKGWDSVLSDHTKMPGAKWFEGSRLNFAKNLLRYRDSETAIIFSNENNTRRSFTYRELYSQTAGLSNALRSLGIKKGDRIAGFMPNVPETVIVMLATASIGAVWSSCSPDFGVKGVLDRFGQIKPKVLFACDGYYYNGKTHDSLQKICGISQQLKSLEKLIIIPYTGSESSVQQIIVSSEMRQDCTGVLWNELVSGAATDSINFESLPFDHPLYIMYSSGTTGLPKSIVHSAGGTLIQHLKELMLHTDLKREDRIFYYTNCGWMMWNWLVSSLAVGSTVVLYDGSPFFPDEIALLDLAEKENLTVFGTSAKYIYALEKAGLKPIETENLEDLRTILSTGSPLAPESFDYVYRDVKQDVCLASISGGTDIISCFALGNPIGEVHRGELQTRGLGMQVEVFDHDGKSVTGQKGDLVCTAPFPSMPVYFWNDPEGKRYHSAYFERFPGVWHHGDYAELTENDGMIIHGRSDAVLNPAGVRIGTAEIYRQVEQLEEIAESIAVGQNWQGTERVILFVKLREGFDLNEKLSSRIKQQIRANTTPHHVPKVILEVKDIPRTISGKIVELAVRNVIHNQPVENIDALANPQALEYFRNRTELGK